MPTLTYTRFLQLMRQKCQVYSTLGDFEENVQIETLLQDRFTECCPSPPRHSTIAAAALYITAILE